MAKYTVHFSGYYGYNVDVEANDEFEAEAKAEKIFDNVSANEFDFEPSPTDVWEARS